ncbi:MAG TPA: class III extradiol ring-cleavage dioxygenase, partial [Kiloniellales bacterium]|nr:class III extradiol ring-cleavage dioxygenase [Kiloniellales bacterium]
QLSLIAGADAAAHLRLGRALAPLRAEGVLVVGSGTAVHNLEQWRRDPQATPDWARAFEDWLVETAAAGDAEAVAEYRTRAPQARLAHPSEEHFLPFAVALGAGGDGAKGRLLHRGFAYGSLSMAAVAFDSAAQVHHMAGDTRDRAIP